MLKKLVTATRHSEGPASQGEAAPPHLVSLIKMYETLQPIGTDRDTGLKKKSASVQNREVAHGIIGIQTSLVSAEEGIRFSTQSPNQSDGKTIVKKSADHNSTIMVLSSDSETSPTNSKKILTKKRPASLKDGKEAQKVLKDHTS